MGLGNNDPEYQERMVFPQISSQCWELPREVVFGGFLWKYDSSVLVTEERTKIVPGRSYLDDDLMWVRLPDSEESVKVTMGYRGSYVKERELS